MVIFCVQLEEDDLLEVPRARRSFYRHFFLALLASLPPHKVYFINQAISVRRQFRGRAVWLST